MCLIRGVHKVASSCNAEHVHDMPLAFLVLQAFNLEIVSPRHVSLSVSLKLASYHRKIKQKSNVIQYKAFNLENIFTRSELSMYTI
jgi:hypothetical protein